MAFLRQGSTRRVVGLLLGAAAALVLLAVAASAALGGGGQPPPSKPLAEAVHDSLGGPKIDGITGRVQFTTHLFDGATTDTSSALLKGGSGRFWAAPGKLRVELQADNGDAQIVVASGKGFVYDGPSNTAYTFAVATTHKHRAEAGHESSPTVAQIQRRLGNLRRQATVGAPNPEVVAGQPAYEVRVSPHDRGGLLGGAALAWDAVRGVPLKIALYARGSQAPAVELAATDIAYGAIDQGAFGMTPPQGAKIVDLGGGSHQFGAHHEKAAKPRFRAVAPRALGTRARRELKPGAGGYIALYGKGLDTIVVVEHRAKPGEAQRPASTSGDGQSLDLPTTSIDGAKATAFGTPLGGVVSFERNGVAYTVAGSQPLSVLEAAARGL